jgi:hypothetical protein
MEYANVADIFSIPSEYIVASSVYKIDYNFISRSKRITLNYKDFERNRDLDNARFSVLVKNDNFVFQPILCESLPCPQYKEQQFFSGGALSIDTKRKTITFLLSELPKGTSYFVALYNPNVVSISF